MAEKKGLFANRIGELIASVVLGFFEVIALSMYYRDSLGFWTASFGNALLFLGLWILSAALIFVFFALMQLLFRPKHIVSDTMSESDIWPARHPFFFSVIVLTVFYLPWVIVFYPGSAIYDMMYQMVQGAGFIPVNAHHPIFATLVIGLLGRFSLLVTGRLELGVFLYILLQTAVCILSFAGMFSFMAKRGARKGFWLSLLGIMAVVPLFGGAMQCGTKDTIFTGFFVIFLTLSARLFLGEGPSFTVGTWILYGGMAAALCLFRNGILVILIPTLAVFFLVLRKEKKTRRVFLLCSAIAIVVSFGFNTAAARVCNTGTETGEILSIPFQQTARYVRDHETEVAEEEAEVIEKTFVLSDYRELGKLYYPMSSDPVKGRYHWWASGEEGKILKEYFGVWGAMLKKHPLTFVEATAANTFGYYSITPVIQNQKGGAGTTVQFFPDQFAVQNAAARSEGALSEDLVPASPEALKPAQEVLSSWYYFWLRAPVLGLFFKCGFYFYLLLAMTIFYGKRKNVCALLSVPMFLLILMAIASPVNEHIRYIFPVCAGLPVLISSAALKQRTETN